MSSCRVTVLRIARELCCVCISPNRSGRPTHFRASLQAGYTLLPSLLVTSSHRRLLLRCGSDLLFDDGSSSQWRHPHTRHYILLQSHIRTYSSRIGGAIALAAAWVPVYFIRIMGRWSSGSFLRYIHINDQVIAALQLRMVLGDPR